jgi:CBS domain-containing protein
MDPVTEELARLEEELDHVMTELPDLALQVPVAELHMRNVHIETTPTATIREAIDLMVGHNVGCLAVVSDGRLAGILSERDILRKVAPEFDDADTRTVSEIMTADPGVLPSGSTVADAIRVMHEGHFRHLPIIDEERRVEAVVSVRNILEYVVDHFPSEVLNLPPHPVERKPMVTAEGA